MVLDFKEVKVKREPSLHTNQLCLRRNLQGPFWHKQKRNIYSNLNFGAVRNESLRLLFDDIVYGDYSIWWNKTGLPYFVIGLSF